MGLEAKRTIPAILLIIVLAGGVLFLNSRRELNAESIIRKAIQQEKKITSYHIILELGSNRDGEKRVHFAQVWYRSPRFYRVEFFPDYPGEDGQPDQIIISDGEKMWLFNPELGDFFALKPGTREFIPSPILLNTFLNGLAGSVESEFLGLEKKEKNTYYLLRIIPPGSRKDYEYEEIWLERKTLLPVQILVYDEQDTVRQKFLFHKTVINLPIPDELFQINEKAALVH